MDDQQNNLSLDHLPEDDFDKSTAEFEAQLEELRQTSENQAIDTEPSVNPFVNAHDNTYTPTDMLEYIPDTGRMSPVMETPPHDVGSLRSPIRPASPELSADDQAKELAESIGMEVEPIDDTPDDSQAALELLRQKMENAAAEFSAGTINKVQFGAIYKHYSEKRAIIERLCECAPDSSAWRQVAEPGHTTFLRDHFEARAVFYAVFLIDQPKPLLIGGTQTEKAVTQINKIMRIIQTKDRPEDGGLARKAIEGEDWLALAIGKYSVTFVIYMFQPSNLQMSSLEDMQADFERANRISLERGTITPDRMVFPQRALIP